MPVHAALLTLALAVATVGAGTTSAEAFPFFGRGLGTFSGTDLGSGR